MPHAFSGRARRALLLSLALILVPLAGSAQAALTPSWSYSPSSPQAGRTITFDASASTGNIADPSGYEWSFGDGQTAQGRKVTHAYASAGVKNVALSVTNLTGRTKTSAKNVTVAAAPVPTPTPTPTATPAPTSPPPGGSLPTRLPESTGTTFYVSPAGSDSNPGSASAPWRTVQKAFDVLLPGQVALVRAGTYSENVVVRRSGTASAPITVRNYPGERPVLHPNPTSPSYPLRLTTGAAFVRVQGFVVERSQGSSTMNVVGLGSNPGAHDYEISDCEIRFAQNSSGVFIDNTNYNVWLLGNTVHDNNEPGVQHQGIYLESDDSVIANNLVYAQTNGFGIQVRSDRASGPDNVIVSNNTVTGVSLSGIMFEHTVSNSRMVNNISAFNTGTGLRGFYSKGDHPNDPVGAGNSAYNNVVYGNGRDLYSDPTPSGATILDFSRGNRVADPKFVNRAAWDLRVQSGSVAIDTATNAWTPPVDRVFTPRPQGASPDRGAYERVG